MADEVVEELVRDSVKVEFSFIGEGFDGEFDASNPSDAPLLRLDVARLGPDGWEQVENSSYCTQVRADTPVETIRHLLDKVMDEVFEDVRDGASVRETCARLSWMDASYSGDEPPERRLAF